MEIIIVTGAKGQLGTDLVLELKRRGYTNIIETDNREINDEPNYIQVDITDEKAVKTLIETYKPEVVFHCAAYTAVDKAESEMEKCYDINVLGTRNITKVCQEVGSKLFYISTDYVFDGTKDGIYEVNDKPNPLSVYGNTKRLGEIEALKNLKTFIVRISWVFGVNGNNFVKTMLRLAKEKEFLNVVNDQVGSPTYTVDLSRLLVDMMQTEKYGVYHATNEGYCSWYDFAKKIFELTGETIPVYPIPTSEYKTAAVRPLNSKLSKQSLIDAGFEQLPTWEDALNRYLEEAKQLKK